MLAQCGPEPRQLVGIEGPVFCLPPVLFDAARRVGSANEPAPLRPGPHAAKQFDHPRRRARPAFDDSLAARSVLMVPAVFPAAMASAMRCTCARVRSRATLPPSNGTMWREMRPSSLTIGRRPFGFTKARRDEAGARRVEIAFTKLLDCQRLTRLMALSGRIAAAIRPPQAASSPWSALRRA